MKFCSKCKVEKDDSEFGKYSRSKDGIRGVCKKCFNDCKKEYRKNNPEKIAEKNKNYRLNNLEKCRQIEKNYRLNNLEKTRDAVRKYRSDNRDKIAEMSKIYRLNNLEKTKEYCKKYKIKNIERIKKWRDDYRIKKNERMRELDTIKRIELSDSYIKRCISQSKFNESAIPQPLVDFHREVIRAKRLLKELQK